MPSEGTIREFLVSLGWSSNETQEQKFNESIEKATLRAKLLSDGIEAAARKVYEAVNDMAERFDALYWAAARTGESATFIKSFSYAISQLGGTTDGAKSSLEGMAQTLRAMPGNVYFTRAIGFDRDPKTGQMLPYNPALAAGPGGVQGMSQSQVELLIQNLRNVDPNVVYAIRRDPYAVQQRMNETADAQRRLGLDPDKAAAQANAVQSAWTKLVEDWGIFGDSLLVKMAPLSVVILKFVDQMLLLTQTSPAAKTIQSGGDARAPWLTAGTKQGRDAASMFDDFEKNKGKLYDQIGIEFHKTLSDLNDEFGKLKDWIVWLVRDSSVAKFFNFVTSGADDHGAAAVGSDVGSTLGDLLSKRSPGAPGSPPSTIADGTLAQHQKELYDALISQGVSDTAARRMVASVSREALRNPADVHSDPSMSNPYQKAHGIASWDDVRSQRIKQQFGKMPNEMTVPEQAAALKWEIQTYYPNVWKTINEGTDEQAMTSLTRDHEGPIDTLAQTEKSLSILRGLPKSFASTSSSNAMVVGDSLAEGIHGYGGVPGGGIVGANTSAVLKEIGDIPGDISGKVVVLSTGLSNDFPNGATGEQIQDKLGVVKSQVGALLSRGVRPEDIRILGFDPKAFPGVNEALKSFVASNPNFAGVQIVPLQGDTDAAQHIHLGAQGYKDTAATALQSNDRAPPTDHWKEWNAEGLTSLDSTSANPSNLASTWLRSQFHSIDVAAPHNVSITVNGDSSSPSSAVGSPVKDVDAFSALRANQVAVGAQ
jgi:hypothetical protein